MQSRAFCRNSPHVYRVVKAVPSTTRTMSLFPRSLGFPVLPPSSMAIAHPFAVTTRSLEREVAPLFQIMDDLNRHFDANFFPFNNSVSSSRTPAIAPFAPRFDVREVEDAYELRGELPGVEAANLQVEFTDPHTLVIRGRTESESRSSNSDSNGEASSATVDSQVQNTAEASQPVETGTSTNAVEDDAASTHSTTSASYQKATVEDEAPTAEADIASTPGQATPAESVASEQAQPTNNNNTVTATNAADAPTDTNSSTNKPHYWISERRTGSFQRVFNFPGKIDQESVTATLKNGVLNVVVPKAVVQQPRRILVN